MTNTLQTYVTYLLNYHFPASYEKDNILLHFIEYDLNTMNIIDIIDLITRYKGKVGLCFIPYKQGNYFQTESYTFYAKVSNDYLRYTNQYEHVRFKRKGYYKLPLFIVEDQSLKKFQQLVNSYLSLLEIKG